MEERSPSRPQNVGDLIDGLSKYLEKTSPMGENQKMYRVWASIMDKDLVAHTTGVFVKDAKWPGAAPVIGVYLDNRLMCVDAMARREVYRGRLEIEGYKFSAIEFIPSRYSRKKQTTEHGWAEETPSGMPTKRHKVPLGPELSEEEMKEVEAMVKELPESLRESAQRAMILTLRRQKS